MSSTMPWDLVIEVKLMDWDHITEEQILDRVNRAMAELGPWEPPKVTVLDYWQKVKIEGKRPTAWMSWNE